MPVEIIQKQKTEPEHINRHPSYVPLKFVRYHRDVNSMHAEEAKQHEAGDVMVIIGQNYATVVFNATKNIIVKSNLLDSMLYVRAYDVKQIIITNDDSPAPVV